MVSSVPLIIFSFWGMECGQKKILGENILKGFKKKFMHFKLVFSLLEMWIIMKHASPAALKDM